MKTLKDFNFKNKKALIRVDFNVPLNDNLEVTDATRIQAAKSTIIDILEQNGSCVLMSHLGRPKGFQNEFSLRNIVKKATEILGVQVKFVADCIGAQVLMERLNVAATSRASFYIYNTKEDVDALIDSLNIVAKVFKL